MGELRNGLRLARRRWWLGLVIGLQITLSAVVTAALLGDVVTQGAVFTGSSALRSAGAVSFIPYYGSTGVTSAAPSAVSDAAEAFASDEAYSLILNNVRVEDPEFLEGSARVFVVGEVARRLNPGARLCTPAPCFTLGPSSPASEAPFDFAGSRFDYQGRLPEGAALVDPNEGVIALDSYVVAVLPESSLPLLDDMESEEMLAKSVLIEPSDAAITGFVDRAGEGGLQLVPVDVARDQPQRLQGLLTESGMYLAGCLAFLLLAVTAFIASAVSVLRSHAPTFRVRAIYGAGPVHAFLRTAGLLVVPMFLLPGAALGAMSLVGGSYTTVAVATLVTLFGLWIVLTSVLSRPVGRV